MSENIQMMKSELNQMKREEFKSNLVKKERIQDYRREMNMMKMKEKEMMFNEMK